MIALSRTFEEEGDYERAAQIMQSAVRLKEREYGFDHPELAENLFDLGLLCWAIEKQSEAEKLLNRSLEIYKRTLGPGHPEVLEVCAVLGELQLEVETLVPPAPDQTSISIWAARMQAS